MKLNQYIPVVKAFAAKHNEALIGVAIVVVAAAVIGGLIYANTPKITYQPVKACSLFTPAEAQSMLGEKVTNVNANEDAKVVGNLATTKCSYTDGNPVGAEQMVVAAVAVRAGVNDAGVEQNKSDFAAAKAASKGQDVANIGDDAYFDTTKGQLNVLHGYNWIILSYGVGAAPEANTLEDVEKLAKKVVS